ncbi:DUF2164 family protein [Sporolactobacillus sp. Y61]|uniref:DUF2164 family protein n=1 Tax=Sporolactobacillus sp. Y61 TaxID=3160863 RepID=A0AAU8ID69_9BACL|nr:DUF2164 family protein [Sporolactobacillus sp. THM19-2]RYL92201.1 DUF2164 family protein [Sporolactobacillus sp. THM19-2]
MELPKRQKDEMIEKLKSCYFDTYHEELGIIGAENLYSCFMEACAPYIYNQALKDVKKVTSRQFVSLEEEIDVLEKKL